MQKDSNTVEGVMFSILLVLFLGFVVYLAQTYANTQKELKQKEQERIEQNYVKHDPSENEGETL